MNLSALSTLNRHEPKLSKIPNDSALPRHQDCLSIILDDAPAVLVEQPQVVHTIGVAGVGGLLVHSRALA